MVGAMGGGIAGGYSISTIEVILWLLALAFYGVGDAVTTYVGVSTSGVAERGPVLSPLLETYGFGAIVAVKLLTFAGFGICWLLLTPPTRVAVPLAVALVGVGVTVWNGRVLWVAVCGR